MADLEITDAFIAERVERRPAAIVVGETFGAYRIEDFIGSGGMGEVYRAHDTRLDRRVAIKVVNRWGEPDESARERLIREALALAKLSHPNILTIYEIGSVGGETFVATEYVEGGTLGTWLQARPRSRREILEVFLQAGRGLAAAHGAGLVHRDFKPANVLMDLDGRARVCDFGLVSGGGVIRAELSSSLTHGALGTPSYMPPEQHDGKTDARSDQYAFCVSLHEALYGVRPFQGDTHEELRRRKLEARLPDPPPGTRVPARLRGAIARGLAVDPDQRHPSMAALIAILERDPAAARRRIALVAATALMAGGVAFAASLGLRQAPVDPCGGGPRRLAGVWDDGVRAAVRERFAASGRPYADEVFRRVAGVLDERARGWADMHREACAATAIRREQSEALLDLRMSCLDARLGELGAVTSIFAASADGKLVDRAVEAVQRVGDVGICADAAALAAVVPPVADPGLRVALEGFRARLAAVHARLLVGRYQEGVSLARGLADELRALPAPQLQSEALLELAELQARVGDMKEAEGSAMDAILAAARSRDDRAAARAWVLRLWIVAFSRPEEALASVPAATAALTRAGNPVLDHSRLLAASARAFRSKGDFVMARESIARGLAMLAATPQAVTERASLLGDMAAVLRLEFRPRDARDSMERALDLLRRQYGEQHPLYASRLASLGNIAADMGDAKEAERHYRHAVAILESVSGETVELANVLNGLANVLKLGGDYEGARSAYTRALGILEQRLGPEHVALGQILDNLGALHTELGEYDAARRSHERAIAIYLPSGHVGVGYSYYNLAEAYRGGGDHAQARAYKQRALELWSKSRPPDHPVVVDALAGVARIDLEAGRLAPALSAVQRVLAARQKSAAEYPREHAAETDLLGDILHAQGKHAAALAQHERAVALLEQAVGKDDLALAEPLTGVGECLLDLGRAAEALGPLERAAGLRGEARGGPRAVARTRLALARALRETGRDPDRALTLETSGRDLLAKIGRGRP